MNRTLRIVSLVFLIVSGCQQRTVQACCEVHQAPCGKDDVPFTLDVAGVRVDMCSPCVITTVLEAGAGPVLVCLP